MRKYWVYVHTCKANGKRYVGITTYSKPEIRWKEGRGYQTNRYFYSAILKHGWDNFEHEVFEVDSAEEMYRKEVELISFYHSNDPEYGYNHSSGGEKSALGCTRSEEFRRHISESNKKRAKDPEFRKKISETLKKSLSDPEVRKKMSEANKKKWSDPEYRKHVSEAQKKVHSDPEYKKHLSEARKKQLRKPHSEETKRRIAETLKGRHRPRIKIQLPDGTIVEVSKHILTRYYINKGKEFEYVS